MFKFFRRKTAETTDHQRALKQRLAASQDNLGRNLRDLLHQAERIDDALLEDLEAVMLGADLGVTTTERIMQALQKAIASKLIEAPAAILPAIQAELFDILEPCEHYLDLELEQSKRPFVILVVGVNGAGKTTTIGKLARRLKDEGLQVMLAAGDTFRAAAVEQLQAWGARNAVPVIAQQTGADPAAVIFDAMQSAVAKNIDVLIADTAGRLHTQDNLMAELQKVRRVIQRQNASAPHEVMLVVDASTGQNALNQARQFNQAVELTGITITKLDGTARGGVLFAIANELRIPIRFVGVGEQLDDLRSFDATSFINAILPLE